MDVFFELDSRKRFDLISIGDLSKLTGVNIKSLRYYEKIGVLYPAYVNPDSGYRYYTYSQVQLVISIQFYVDLGIPLSTLHRFTDGDTQEVNFREQISYGIEIAQERLLKLKKQVEHSKNLLSEIDRCNKIFTADEPIKFELPEKTCWAIPIQGKITKRKYYSTLRILFAAMQTAGMKIGSETGILLRQKNSGHELFIFADVSQGTHTCPLDNIQYIHIDKREYLCKPVPFDVLSKNNFETNVLTSSSDVVILTELFTSKFNYRKPAFELRQSIQKRK